MPVCHYVLAVLFFLATPIIIIVAYVSLLASEVETGVLFPYFTFYTILTFLITIQFFVSLLDVFERLKQEHADARARFQAGKEMEEATKRLDADGEEERNEQERINEFIWKLPPYEKQGTQAVKLREDMYSLLFVSLVKPQFKKYCDLVDMTGQSVPFDAEEPA